MIERTIGMQATIKQADLLAWASDERRDAEAARGWQKGEWHHRRVWRAVMARMLVVLAVRLDNTVAMRATQTSKHTAATVS
jgi:hypothetical protein